MKRYFLILHSILILCIAQPLLAEVQYTLKQCREQALQNNRKLKQAQLDKEAAGEQRKEAFTNYFPQVNSMAGVFKTNKDLVQLPGMSFLDGGYVANITATQPLFAGGQIINGYKMTKISEEVKAIQLKQTEEEICITTEAYYYQLLALLEKRHTLEVVNTQLKQIYLDVSNSYQAGISKKNDVLNVQLKLNEVASNQLTVNNGIQLSKMLLAQYIGLNTDSFQIDCNLLKELSPAESYKVDHEAALSQTKEFQLLNKNIEANHLEYKLKVGAQLPTVAVGAGYTLHNLMDENQNFGMLFATVKVPISQWWGGSHAIKRQKISEQIAKLGKEDNAQLLLIRMQQTYDNLAQAYQQVQLAESSKTTATENLRLNQDYYHAGTVALSDLLDAQTQQQQAFNQYTDAVVSYLNSRSAYLRASNQMF